VNPNDDEITLCVYLHDFEPGAVESARKEAPKGVIIGPVEREALPCGAAAEYVPAILITIAPFALDFAKDVATSALRQTVCQWTKEWLEGFLAKIKANRLGTT
jgi:hypothetical protein